jgi:hypothetical protein
MRTFENVCLCLLLLHLFLDCLLLLHLLLRCLLQHVLATH